MNGPHVMAQFAAGVGLSGVVLGFLTVRLVFQRLQAKDSLVMAYRPLTLRVRVQVFDEEGAIFHVRAICDHPDEYDPVVTSNPQAIALFSGSIQGPQFQAATAGVVHVVAVAVLEVSDPGGFLVAGPFVHHGRVLRRSGLLFRRFVFLHVLFFPQGR